MEVGVSVAGKVMDLVFGVAKKEISYMWNCSENIENLKKEAAKLSSMKGRVQQQIESAKSNGECLLEGVEEWMNIATAKIFEAQVFAEEAEAHKTCCNLRFCVNLGALYRYGKMATKKTSFLLEHQEGGKGFETCVSLPATTPGVLDLYQTKDLENINTQKSSLKKIIQAIKDFQIVGIIGLGGVGKTTLAKEVAVEMKNQFAHIEFLTISQTIEATKIKKEVEVAARRIINGEKVLIILDDVWKELKLDEVGIPCGSKFMSCKILLTSRKEDVCKGMGAKIVELNPLKEKEAWTLFKSVVGEREWDDRLIKVALDIVEECKGLPLFVQAVGKALKNRETRSWLAALHRLQDPTDENDEYKRNGIAQLKLSYDYLESEVTRSCFLLCSLFPEDEFIDVERLAYYGLALGIFNNPDCNIQKAQDKVQGAVDTLKSSFLLLPEKVHRDQELFRMHDLVRDMAILITSKGDDMFWVQSGEGLTEWKPRKDIIKGYKKISLMRNSICTLSNNELLLPHLDTFLIQNNKISSVPNEFFRGMTKLKVLDMSCNWIASLPQSLEQLSELTMLDLSRNISLSEISILGKLTCLEILKLRWTGITTIPEEIGQLTNLRVLDVSSCKDLSNVTPGVISKLIRLEELYIELSKEGNCEFLVELRELKSLVILHLVVPKLHYLPEDFQYDTLIEFQITNKSMPYIFNGYKRALTLSEFNSSFTTPVMKLIQLSEALYLNGIKDLDNILPSLYREGLDELKFIIVEYCDNVKRLVKTCELGPMKTKGKFFSKVEYILLSNLGSLEVLLDRPHPYISFCNLIRIDISECDSLLEVFPFSGAQELFNLREISIHRCKSLVVVISTRSGIEIEETSRSKIEQTDRSEIEETCGCKTENVKQDLDIIFPFLTRIYLYQLPKLVSFYSGHSTIKYPSLKSMSVPGCGSMKRWSYGENNIPNIKFEHEGKPYNDINDYIAAQLEVNGELCIAEPKSP